MSIFVLVFFYCSILLEIATHHLRVTVNFFSAYPLRCPAESPASFASAASAKRRLEQDVPK